MNDDEMIWKRVHRSEQIQSVFYCSCLLSMVIFDQNGEEDSKSQLIASSRFDEIMKEIYGQTLYGTHPIIKCTDSSIDITFKTS